MEMLEETADVRAKICQRPPVQPRQSGRGDAEVASERLGGDQADVDDLLDAERRRCARQRLVDRHQAANPVALLCAAAGAAIAVNGAVITALLFANPEFVRKIVPEPIGTIVIEPIPEPKPQPKPEPRNAEPRPQPSTTVVTPIPEIKPIDLSPINPIGDAIIRDPAGSGTSGIDPIERAIEPPAPPLFVAARQDPRYLGDFQPVYPDYERDAGREDVVRLKIRIGIDGRVKQAERLAGRDSFARVAIAHALAKWRFRPATRGGVPEESWREMTVRFTLNG